MAAAALGSAWVLTGCGGDPAPRPVPRGAPTDIDALSKLLELERRAERAYAELSPLLPAGLRSFREHEAEHALAVAQAMRDLGAAPPAPAAAAVPRIRSRHGAVEFLTGIENASLAGYLGAIERISSGDLRATLGAALAVDAEHVTELVMAVGARPLFLGEGR